MSSAFIYGALLTLGLIFPLGPQNIFIFNQGATQRHYLHALPSVLTAFSCDALLIIGSILGVSVAVLALPWLKTGILMVGFVFLMYIGWSTWKSAVRPMGEEQIPLSIKQQILFATSCSLLNPHAILDSIGIIGTNSLNFIGGAKYFYTGACLSVSFTWFLSLSIAGHFLHKMDKSGKKTMLINKLSALIMWGVGFYFLKQIIWR